MTITGIFRNGTIVPDVVTSWPEGARVVVALADEAEVIPWRDFDGASLPPDHPMAPYDRDVEIAILRESIAETKAGISFPFEESMAEIAKKHGLPSVQQP